MAEVWLAALTVAVLALGAAVAWLAQRPPTVPPPSAPRAPIAPPRLRMNRYGELED